jgi:hypothetical protein
MDAHINLRLIEDFDWLAASEARVASSITSALGLPKIGLMRACGNNTRCQ